MNSGLVPAILGAQDPTGYVHDLRLENVLDLIVSKQDDQGRWELENSLSGEVWIDIEEKGKPSKW